MDRLGTGRRKARLPGGPFLSTFRSCVSISRIHRQGRIEAHGENSCENQ